MKKIYGLRHRYERRASPFTIHSWTCILHCFENRLILSNIQQRLMITDTFTDSVATKWQKLSRTQSASIWFLLRIAYYYIFGFLFNFVSAKWPLATKIIKLLNVQHCWLNSMVIQPLCRFDSIAFLHYHWNGSLYIQSCSAGSKNLYMWYVV